MNKERMIDSINFAKIPLFHGLNKNNLEKLKTKLEMLNFKAGEIIFNEGEIGDCMYIVIDGKVKVFITDEKGGIHEVARITSGNGSEGDIELLEELGQYIRETSLCELGVNAPNYAISTIKFYRNVYETHIRDKKCPAGICKI